MKSGDVCLWRVESLTLSDDETWLSSCGTAYVFIDGGPTENGHVFCHSCGKPINRRSAMDDLIEALTIFKKYGNPSSPTICTHDKLYITGEIRPDDVSSEDRERLEELGFLVDSGLDQFYSYRFGSA